MATKNLLNDFLVDLCINVNDFQVPYHFFYDRFSPFVKLIKQDHPFVFDSLIQLIRNYSNVLNLDFSIYENHLIYLFVISLPSILKPDFDKSCLIISNYSKEHSLFMASTIQKQLSLNPIHFNEDFCIHIDELNQYDLHTFDLIITNTEINLKEIPYMLINDFPDKKDIVEIQSFLSSNNFFQIKSN